MSSFDPDDFGPQPRDLPPGGHRPSRRDFLGLLGVALGGITLAGCGGANIPASSLNSGLVSLGGLIPVALPNGYRFESLLDSRKVSDLGGIQDLTPVVALNDQGQVVFYAQNPSGYGLYEAETGTRSRVQPVNSLRPVIYTGQTLADGKNVGRITSWDVNNQGTIATTVQAGFSGDPEHTSLKDEADGVYLERGGAGSFEPILSAGQAVPGVNGMFGGAFGDVDVSENDNVLATAFYSDGDAGEPREGLIVLPHAENPRVVVHTGEAIPGTNHVVTSLGLVDAGMNGDMYSIQATGEDGNEYNDLGHSRANNPNSMSRATFVAVGRMGQPFSRSRVITASPRLSGTRSVQTNTGDVFFGPRTQTDPALSVTIASEPHGDRQTMYVNTTPLVSNFDDGTVTSRTPGGQKIVTVSAPVLGHGLVYYQAVTDLGMEIIVTNGTQHRTIISRGDKIADKTVETVVFGFHPDQVSRDGSMILYVEMTDGSAAYLKGVPV